MSVLSYIGLLAFWLLLQTWLLPKLGVATCAVPLRQPAELQPQRPSMSTFPTRTFRRPFDDVLADLPAALKTEGFGVLTEIDMQATLLAKLGVTFRKYRILGACNPPLAHEALSTDLRVGVALPCNVVIYERDDGQTQVMAVDPLAAMSGIGNAELEEPATQVRDKLAAAIAAVPG